MDVCIRLFHCLLELSKNEIRADAFFAVPFCENDSQIGIALQDVWRECVNRIATSVQRGWAIDRICIGIKSPGEASEIAKAMGGDLHGKDWHKVLSQPIYVTPFQGGISNGKRK